MLTWRDIWVYVRMLIRWWWVGIVCVGLSAGIAFAIVRQQPDYYQSRMVLMVGDNFSAAAPNPYAFGLSNTLAQFYAVMAKREAILQPVVDQLQLPYSWEILEYQIYASVNSQANLLELWVTDTDPDRAAAIASAIGSELIKFSPNSPEKIAEQRSVFEQQISETEQNLQSVETRLKELQAQQTTLVSAVDLRTIEDQIAELEKVRDRYQDSYNQLLELRNTSTVNSLTIFEAARRPEYALPSQNLLTVAAAGAGGAVLSLLAILLLEALDDRWRTARDLRSRFGIADLGSIPNVIISEGTSRPTLSDAREQAVRDAHTRILLAALERGSRLLMVTSPAANPARSAFVIDMARLFTRSGYRVLLVDADMEEPHLTSMLGQNEQAIRPVLVHNADVKVWSHLQPTEIENVMLLGRKIGPDGRPLTPSLPWPDLVQSLNRAADVIIFDGPSALGSADAALLAPLVDGVVLTLDPVNDRRGAIMETRSRLLRRKGTVLLGAVVLENSPKHEKARRKALAAGKAAPQLTAGPAPAEPDVEPQADAGPRAEPGLNTSGGEIRLSSAMSQAISRGLLIPPQANGSRPEAQANGHHRTIAADEPQDAILTIPPASATIDLEDEPDEPLMNGSHAAIAIDEAEETILTVAEGDPESARATGPAQSQRRPSGRAGKRERVVGR